MGNANDRGTGCKRHFLRSHRFKAGAFKNPKWTIIQFYRLLLLYENESLLNKCQLKGRLNVDPPFYITPFTFH